MFSLIKIFILFDKIDIKTISSNVLFNQLIVSLPYLLFCGFFSSFNYNFGNFDIILMLKEMIFIILFVDIFFFYYHSSCHEREFYKFNGWHSVHHIFNDPIPLCSQYSNSIDYFFMFFFSPFIGVSREFYNFILAFTSN